MTIGNLIAQPGQINQVFTRSLLEVLPERLKVPLLLLRGQSLIGLDLLRRFTNQSYAAPHLHEMAVVFRQHQVPELHVSAVLNNNSFPLKEIQQNPREPALQPENRDERPQDVFERQSPVAHYEPVRLSAASSCFEIHPALQTPRILQFENQNEDGKEVEYHHDLLGQLRERQYGDFSTEKEKVERERGREQIDENHEAKRAQQQLVDAVVVLFNAVDTVSQNVVLSTSEQLHERF